MESLQLRVKDIDFAYRQITIREGKGNKDRPAPLPATLVDLLQSHLGRVRDLHNRDLAERFGTVYLPHALAVKYPRANREWSWLYVFPSTTRGREPQSGEIRRHHWHDQNVQRALRKAARYLSIKTLR